MFNDKQLQLLKYDLDVNRIRSRSKGNLNLSYLEGFDIIETANKIFGYGNWDYSISTLEQVSQETNQNQNNVICYKAIVKVVVHDLKHTAILSREDVGFGTGIAKTLADAHESGAKEAVTDSLKRTMRSFGSQFGNLLYDKSKNHQNRQQPQQIEQPIQQLQNPSSTPVQSQSNQYDFSSLYNLGLRVIEQDNSFVVAGEDIFSKKDSIKACGFRWDASHKVWYLPKNQQQAA